MTRGEPQLPCNCTRSRVNNAPTFRLPRNLTGTFALVSPRRVGHPCQGNGVSPSWQRTWQHTVAQTRQTHDNFSRTHHHPLRMKIHYSTYMRCDEPIAGTISPGWRTHSAQQPADDFGDCIQTTKPASSIQLTKLVSDAINEIRAWVKTSTDSKSPGPFVLQPTSLPFCKGGPVHSTRPPLHNGP